MTREDARQKADTIIGLFWHNFQKSESAFVMRDVIAIALENASSQTELPGKPMIKLDEPKIVRTKTLDALFKQFGSHDIETMLGLIDEANLKIVEK